MTEWTFVSNHGAVLVAVASRGRITAVQIAQELGITERSVRRIISDLEAAGYLRKRRDGRVNRYEVNSELTLRRKELRDIPVGRLIATLAGRRRA